MHITLPSSIPPGRGASCRRRGGSCEIAFGCPDLAGAGRGGDGAAQCQVTAAEKIWRVATETKSSSCYTSNEYTARTSWLAGGKKGKLIETMWNEIKFIDTCCLIQCLPGQAVYLNIQLLKKTLCKVT